MESAHTWPVRSTSIQELMAVIRGFWQMMATLFVNSTSLISKNKIHTKCHIMVDLKVSEIPLHFFYIHVIQNYRWQIWQKMNNIRHPPSSKKYIYLFPVTIPTLNISTDRKYSFLSWGDLDSHFEFGQFVSDYVNRTNKTAVTVFLCAFWSLFPFWTHWITTLSFNFSFQITYLIKKIPGKKNIPTY
jgi:hypothetical protein